MILGWLHIRKKRQQAGFKSPSCAGNEYEDFVMSCIHDDSFFYSLAV